MTTTATDDPPLILWGRCRSGRRWFWTAREVGGDDIHGWADTHPEASRQANAAAIRFAAGRYANIHVLHGVATTKLKALNSAKRAAAPPPKDKRTGRRRHAQDAKPIGYLYAIDPGRYDADERHWIPASIIRLPITKKTAKRVYYLRPRGPIEWEPGYVDRQELEAHGQVRAAYWLFVSAEPPDLEPPKPAAPDLKVLKAAMAAAHPDRGGTNEAFIAAHRKYQQALGLAKR